MSDISIREYTTIVKRAVCAACGSTGPMAISADAAERLAILCGWGINGYCQNCLNLLDSKPRSASRAKPEVKPEVKPKGKK